MDKGKWLSMEEKMDIVEKMASDFADINRDAATKTVEKLIREEKPVHLIYAGMALYAVASINSLLDPTSPIIGPKAARDELRNKIERVLKDTKEKE